jgi:hypothetical protein
MGIPWAAIIVVVNISDNVSSTKILEHNKAIVSSIFERIGVQIRWSEGEPGPGSFGIRVVEHAPPSASPEAMASTRLAGGAITVFADRVRQRLSRAHPGAAKVALAYVFAHELAHAMQGVGRHSESGILKAHWTNDDFTAMLFNRLAFTEFDLNLIRQRLSTRPAKFTK